MGVVRPRGYDSSRLLIQRRELGIRACPSPAGTLKGLADGQRFSNHTSRRLGEYCAPFYEYRARVTARILLPHSFRISQETVAPRERTDLSDTPVATHGPVGFTVTPLLQRRRELHAEE